MAAKAGVEDREARHAERGAGVREHTAIVRTTVVQGADHRGHAGAGRVAAVIAPNSADATHKKTEVRDQMSDVRCQKSTFSAAQLSSEYSL